MSSNDPFGDAIRRYEQQERLIRQAAQVDPFEHQRRLIEQVEQLRIGEAIHKRFSTGEDSFVRVLQAFEDAERRERQLRSMLGPVGHAKHLGEIVRAMQAAEQESTRHSRPHDPLNTALARIEGQSERWQRQLREMEQGWPTMPSLNRQLIQSAVSAYEETLQRGVALALSADVAVRFPDLAGKLLTSAEGFGEYATAALPRAADNREPEEQAVVVAAVALAEGQVLASADAQEEWLGDEPVAHEGAPGDEIPDTGLGGDAAAGALLARTESGRIAHFFLVQEADVRAHAALLFDAMGRPLVQVVPTAHRSEQQREFCRLVKACNVDARMHHPTRPTPFSVGESLLGFFTEMGLIDGSSREGLGDLIDGLYFTLYEATNKKRTLREYLPDAECAVADRVQNLRNRMFRHNRERERPEVVRLQAQELLVDLRALGLSGEPHSAEERILLHDRVLGDAIAMLRSLLERIRR